MYKKCIVLDLDNTLWGGVLGEDGMEGLRLGMTPPGSYFIAFQQALLDMHGRGIILAINSRNTEGEALSVIRNHPHMLLREKHFAAWRINWLDKGSNMAELAAELNIGLDSLVFLDDDPHQRGIVKSTCPQVEVPDLPSDPAEYARFLTSLPYFPSDATTDEDAMRGNFYVTERLRRESERRFASREEFLASLGIQITVSVDDPRAASRLAQLSQKTNQFNTNKDPMTEERVLEMMHSPDWRVLHAQVSDAFGDSGITLSAMIDVTKRSRWTIVSLLASCRILGRGIEDAFLCEIEKQARKEGASELELVFVPSEKNAPAAAFASSRFPDGIRRLSDEPSWPSWITATK